MNISLIMLGKASSQTYGKYLPIGDFSAEETKPRPSQFLHDYIAASLVHKKTCRKLSIILVVLIFLLLMVQIVLRVRQLFALGYLTFINLW